MGSFNAVPIPLPLHDIMGLHRILMDADAPLALSHLMAPKPSQVLLICFMVLLAFLPPRIEFFPRLRFAVSGIDILGVFEGFQASVVPSDLHPIRAENPSLSCTASNDEGIGVVTLLQAEVYPLRFRLVSERLFRLVLA